MRLLFKFLFFAVLILWIVYAKDFLLPHFQAQFGELLGYIGNGLAVFAGGWILWRLFKR